MYSIFQYGVFIKSSCDIIINVSRIKSLSVFCQSFNLDLVYIHLCFALSVMYIVRHLCYQFR